MNKRQERLERMNSIEREFQAASLAVTFLGMQLDTDPALLTRHKLRRRDFVQLRVNLSATYLVRLFAEFETGLREAWRFAFRKSTHPKTADLLLSIGAQRVIVQDVQDEANRVRRYRNALVHETDEAAQRIPVSVARSALCTFFSFLPLDW